MSMFNDKNVIDKYFQDNWTETPISFDGVGFDIPTDNKWVSVAMVVYDRSLYAISPQHGRKLDYGKIIVRCYDISPTLVMKLCAKVQEFLECHTIIADDGKEILVDMGISDDLGVVNLDNGIFEVQLGFKIKKYN